MGLDSSKSDLLEVPYYQKSTRVPFVKALRPICKHFCTILLRGYITGLRLYSKRLPKESAQEWLGAIIRGEEGVEGSGDGEGVGMEREANDLAAEGLEALKNRYVTR